MYQDELNREAKMFVQGLQYILDDIAHFFHDLKVALGFNGRR